MKNLILFITIAFFSINAFTQDNASEIILNGSTSGYEAKDFDDQLDFGLIIPILEKSEIFNFSLSSILSSKTDTIRTAGSSIKIPSNIALPKQREKYLFLPINVKKPNFRLPVRNDKPPKAVILLAGSMPFTNTIKSLRKGAPLFSVINSFVFKSFSLNLITDLESTLELTAGENLIKDHHISFNVPFEIDKDFISLGLNLSSYISRTGAYYYFPTGIKTLETPQDLSSKKEYNTPIIVVIPKNTFTTNNKKENAKQSFSSDSPHPETSLNNNEDTQQPFPRNLELFFSSHLSTEETVKKPLPFSLVWNESQPTKMLPLGKDFVVFKKTDKAQSIFIDNSKLLNFKILTYNLTTFNSEGVILSENTFKTMESMTWALDIPISRIRLDVLAVDPGDPIVESINSLYMFDEDIIEQAKYITRYEKDIN